MLTSTINWVARGTIGPRLCVRVVHTPDAFFTALLLRSRARRRPKLRRSHRLPSIAVFGCEVLSWSALLKDSLMAVPNQIATLLDCYVSVQRIQQLLTCQARELTRERLGV